MPKSRAKTLYGSVPDKSRTALLIIDVINDFKFPEAEELLKYAVPMSLHLKRLAQEARKASIPVIYINDNFGKWRSDFNSLVKHCLKGSGRKVVENLVPKKNDYFVLKPKHSAFYSTSLNLLLECLGARTLIITGIASNICVLFTANDAYMRDYKIRVPSDCVCANTANENKNALLQIEKVLKADVKPASKIDFKSFAVVRPLRMLKNRQLAELLALEADKFKPPLSRAFKRASRASILWPEEAFQVADRGDSLTTLNGIGPFMEKTILQWFDQPPLIPKVPDIRKGFIFMSEAKKVLKREPPWRNSLKGDLQMHTKWSDGSATIAEMAAAAADRRYEFIAITDHAKALRIAGGIDERELKTQAKEIEKVNDDLEAQNLSLRGLRSVELNLDVTGKGDLDSECLNSLDIVLGAFHSALRRTDDQTARYLGAMKQREIHIFGHPRTRIYNYRLGLKVDWRRVFDAAAKQDIAVEIDCYPDRQDLDTQLLKIARQSGARISLGTDSHHPWQFEFIELGLAAAITAKIPKDRIVNFMTREELLEWATR